MFIATISINDKKFHFQNDDKKFLEKFVKSILDIIILLNTEHTKLEDKRFAAREKFKKTLPNHSSKPKKKVIVEEDENGNSWKWFTNSDTELVSYERGAYIFADTFVNLSATVKKHDLHEKFGKSTIMNRLKVTK